MVATAAAAAVVIAREASALAERVGAGAGRSPIIGYLKMPSDYFSPVSSGGGDGGDGGRRCLCSAGVFYRTHAVFAKKTDKTSYYE